MRGRASARVIGPAADPRRYYGVSRSETDAPEKALHACYRFLDDTLGLPRIYDNANLGLALLASTTTATTVWGTVSCAYG